MPFDQCECELCFGGCRGITIILSIINVARAFFGRYRVALRSFQRQGSSLSLAVDFSNILFVLQIYLCV